MRACNDLAPLVSNTSAIACKASFRLSAASRFWTDCSNDIVGRLGAEGTPGATTAIAAGGVIEVKKVEIADGSNGVIVTNNVAAIVANDFMMALLLNGAEFFI